MLGLVFNTFAPKKRYTQCTDSGRTGDAVLQASDPFTSLGQLYINPNSKLKQGSRVFAEVVLTAV